MNAKRVEVVAWVLGFGGVALVGVGLAVRSPGERVGPLGLLRELLAGVLGRGGLPGWQGWVVVGAGVGAIAAGAMLMVALWVFESVDG